MVKGVWRVALVPTIAISVIGAALAQDDKVEAAISLIGLLDRPGQINLATVWDGNRYVQCRPMDDRSIRCEAAGTLMQPSLTHVLTPERIGRLTARGWVLDPSFGKTSAKVIAEEIVTTLS